MLRIDEELMDQLFVRYFTDVTLYNKSMSKCFRQLEKMYWYYCDINNSPEKPSIFGMRKFVNEMKFYLSHILPEELDLNIEFDKWIISRKTIPRVKVILMDSELKNVVLTKNITSDFLLFPGGKVDEDDTDLVETAIRKTFEETGIDISDKINPDQYFDLEQYGMKNRYFVITNIDKNMKMSPNSHNEIEYIKWFSLQDLPNNVKKYKLHPYHTKLIRYSVPELKKYLANMNK